MTEENTGIPLEEEDDQQRDSILLSSQASKTLSEFLNALTIELVKLRIQSPFDVTKDYEEIFAQELRIRANSTQINQDRVEEVLREYGSPQELADLYLSENPDEQLPEPIQPTEEVQVDDDTGNNQSGVNIEVVEAEDEFDLMQIIDKLTNGEALTYGYLTLILVILAGSLYRYEIDISGSLRQNGIPAHAVILLFVLYEIGTWIYGTKIISTQNYLYFRSIFTSLVLFSILSNIAFYFDTDINLIGFYSHTLIYGIYFGTIYINDLISNYHTKSWSSIIAPSQIVLLMGLSVGLGVVGLSQDTPPTTPPLAIDILISLSLALSLASLIVEYARNKEVTPTKTIFVSLVPVLLIRLYTYNMGSTVTGNFEKIFSFTMVYYAVLFLIILIVHQAVWKKLVLQIDRSRF